MDRIGLDRRLPHAHSATAFHFLISKRLPGLRDEKEEAAASAAGGGAASGASVSMADILSRSLSLSRSLWMVCVLRAGHVCDRERTNQT